MFSEEVRVAGQESQNILDVQSARAGSFSTI